nr:MAG TPA: hypothetical protein [Caudoviricetes sp.]
MPPFNCCHLQSVHSSQISLHLLWWFKMSHTYFPILHPVHFSSRASSFS